MGSSIMTHSEQRLEEHLSAIRDRVRAVANEIELGLENAVLATLTLDRQLASQVVLGDKLINREIRDIDKMCHGFVARHLPSAGQLRLVSSVLRLNVELERIGDYAVAIAREAIQLSAEPGDSVGGDIQLIAEQALRMFRQAMESFNDGNTDLARATKGMASHVESTYQKIFIDLVREGERGTRPIKDLFALLVIFNRFGRVSDQAKNICEDTLFAVSGETKGEKIYRILFVDERNDAISQLATAYGRKTFPESGEFASAGWNPADRLLPVLEVFLQAKGLDGEELGPRQLDCTTEELANFHVIVALDQTVAYHLEEIPFHTVFLQWNIQPVPNDLDTERATAWLEEASQILKDHLHELMKLLRGEDAL
jgi:phosphate transport system protein